MAEGEFTGYDLTPDELLACRKLLRVDEAAYILNVSGRNIRSLIQRGYLRRSPIYPVRIPVEDVKRLMEEVGIWEAPGAQEMDRKALEMCGIRKDNEKR